MLKLCLLQMCDLMEYLCYRTHLMVLLVLLEQLEHLLPAVDSRSKLRMEPVESVDELAPADSLVELVRSVLQEA